MGCFPSLDSSCGFEPSKSGSSIDCQYRYPATPAAQPRLDSVGEALVNLKFQAETVVGGSLECAKFDLGSWNCPLDIVPFLVPFLLSRCFFLFAFPFRVPFLFSTSTAPTGPDSGVLYFYKKTI